MTATHFKSGDQLSAKSILTWRIVQAFVWLTGAGILFCLLFFPKLGLLLFWNILIPIAPALFVFATGVWRNICPLATTTLLPRHLGLSKQKRLTKKQSGILGVIAVVALYLIVPLRHAVFNVSGPATAYLIIAVTTVGVVSGFFYEWKSAWCSGLCPVHPVEKLYGNNVILSMPNAHCTQCRNCVIPCPDSTPNIRPLSSKYNLQQWSGILIAGGLPGFIWGWFQVPDVAGIGSPMLFLSVYLKPFAGLAITLGIYLLLIKKLFPLHTEKITGIFAAAAVSCYYWYRIPWLLGFGSFAQDGRLADFTAILPEWSILALTLTITLVFFYRIVIRKSNKKSWVIRPPFASGITGKTSGFPGLVPGAGRRNQS
jgi:hypothetical protein